MTNGIILSLSNAGILNITADTFPINEDGNKAAYRVYKFKRAIEAALKDLQSSEQGLLKECGIDDGAAFDERLKVLREKEERTAEETEELSEMTSKLEKYIGRRSELYNEERKLDVLPVSWDMWRMLIAENKDVKILSDLEPILEGIIWEAPTE